MIKDLEHWLDKDPPLSPNEYEIELYKHHSKGHGPVCLLGMTKQLQPLCDYMVDLYPIKQTKPVLKMNWNDFDQYADLIIGDGVINLEGLQLVNKLLKNCNKLICRVFLEKFSWMKYATHFPKEFPGSSLVIPTQENIAIVIWEK
jgi:hypothetical protein